MLRLLAVTAAISAAPAPAKPVPTLTSSPHYDHGAFECDNPRASSPGDGYCDSENNYSPCWDGGDCCESTCGANCGGDDPCDYDCGDDGYSCLQPDEPQPPPPPSSPPPSPSCPPPSPPLTSPSPGYLALANTPTKRNDSTLAVTAVTISAILVVGCLGAAALLWGKRHKKTTFRLRSMSTRGDERGVPVFSVTASSQSFGDAHVDRPNVHLPMSTRMRVESTEGEHKIASPLGGDAPPIEGDAVSMQSHI